MTNCLRLKITSMISSPMSWKFWLRWKVKINELTSSLLNLLNCDFTVILKRMLSNGLVT